MAYLNINSKKILNNGLEMPVIGLGVYKVKDGEEVENSVKWALSAGYRMIDTAQRYGNEKGVGRAVKESGLNRKDIFITTKLWNENQGYENTLSTFNKSLISLEVEYVDLFLIHSPTAYHDFSKTINKREETWQAMEEIYKNGKAKAIGVSNYNISHLEEMKKYAKVAPVVNQVEFNPFLYQKELLDYCDSNKITLEAYMPLTRGEKLNNKKVKEIADKYKKTSAQVLLRWSLQHGCIVIPKSIHKERVEENIDIFDFGMSQEDMDILDGLNENLRLCWDPTNLQ